MELISTHAIVYMAMMVHYARIVSINIAFVLYFIEKITYFYLLLLINISINITY